MRLVINNRPHFPSCQAEMLVNELQKSLPCSGQLDPGRVAGAKNIVIIPIIPL